MSAEPVFDGERWADIFGRFGAMKTSVSEVAAVGRSIAFYREKPVEIEGSRFSVIDAIKRFLVEEPDGGPEMFPGGRIPDAYFDDAHLMRLPRDQDVEFVDLEHPRTRELVKEQSGHLLRAFDIDQLPAMASSIRDRRVTRLITTSLRAWFRSVEGYEHVAGLRYRGTDAGWDAYVLWEPTSLDFDAAGFQPLGPCDSAVRSAAEHLGLDDPCP